MSAVRPKLLTLLAAVAALAVAAALCAIYVYPAHAQEGSAPDKPTGLEATTSHGQVVLTWDDPGDDSITGYVILRRVRVNDQGGDFSELVANTETAATTYTDATVAASTTYTYRIKAINEHGVSERSRWFHIETPAAPEPVNSPAIGAPAISGTVQVGEELTAGTSGIADEDGLENAAFSYQWLAEGFDISGATARTYTLSNSDEGQAITVQVNFTDDAGNDETLTSAPTDAVAAAQPTEPPAKPTDLSATATHNQVLLTWKDPNDDSVTGYVILRRVRANNTGGDFSELVADTGSAATTYTDDTVAASTTYTYRVKAINEHGVSERSRWFHIETPAAPEPVNSPATGAPAISGIAQVGETLAAGTAGIADADGLTTAAYTYQWKADDTDIAGATGSTYTLAADDEGKAIKVLVSFIDDAGNDEALTSAATDAVAAAQPTEPPDKPTGLTAEAGHDQVVLSWDDPGDDSITGHMILRRDKAIHEEGTFATVSPDTGSAETMYTDDTVEPNQQYVYRIKAINAAGLSEISSWVRAYTPEAPATSQRRSAYIDAHNAGVHDVAELLGATDPLNPDAGDTEEEDEGETGNGGKPVGGKPGKNIGPRATVNICDRTPEVVDALLDAIEDNGHASVTCSTVTDAQLAEVFEISVDGYSSDEIVPSDFAGLTGLEELLIRGSLQLTTVQASAFSELSASPRFGSLLLGGNRIKTVHRDAFAGLSLSDSYWPTPRISLGGNVIETLPLGVFDEVTGLEGLELQYNHISGFEEGFFANLPDLEELSLTGNDIKFIPTGMFKGLATLTYLGLSHNALTAVEADYFEDLLNLVDLNLGYNDISRLHPDSFSGLASLEDLNLQRNVIEELPTGLFSDLNSLTELRITTNDIESLDSKTFEGASNIEMLYLNGNYLVSLPEDVFKDLDDLQWLSLDYNYLAELPADIFDPLDDTLTRLDLNNNNFGTLPGDVFDGLTGLDTLLMHRAGLTSLPANLFQPLDESLLYLYLDGNRLTTLDVDLFDGLTGLSRLYLNGNRLTALPSGIFDAPGRSLRYLFLSDNDFSSLPANIFEGLDFLQILIMHRAGLDELDPNLFQTPGSSLYYLYLFGNDIRSLDENIFDGLTGLNRLYLQGNDLTSLPENVFDGLTGLSRLYLDGNDLTELHENIFDDLSSLGDLNLDENLLSALPANVFDGLDDSLTDLYLRDNILTELPSGVFAGLTGLQRLDLSCNALTALDLDEFDPFAGTLKYLDLDANNFSTPPTATAVRAKLMALESLYLNGTRPCLPAFDVGLSELSISNGTLTPPFVPPGRFGQYDAHVGHEVSTLTITTAPRNPNAVIAEPPASHGNWSYDDDPDTLGLQVELGPRGGSARWQVIAENGISSTDYYSVVAFREHPPGSLARLRSLKLSGLPLSPDFSSTTYNYEAYDPSATQTSVTAIPIDPDAGVAITVDGVSTEADVAAEISPDTGNVTVKVTAEDGETTRTYTVTFTEPDPSVSELPGGDCAANRATDCVVGVGRSVTGNIDSETDKDWFKVELEAGKTYQFDMEGKSTKFGIPTDPIRGTLTDTWLFLYDESGTLIIAYNDDRYEGDIRVSRNSRIIQAATSAGAHYLDARGSIKRMGTYTLSVRDITPADDPPGDPSDPPPVDPNRPQVTLHLSNDDVTENSFPVTVTATVWPTSSVPFTVEVSATPASPDGDFGDFEGPATADDFTLSANRVLRFAALATASTGTVTIRFDDDDVPEPDEVVTVSGVVPDPDIPDPDDVTLTILNDDSEAFDIWVTKPATVDEDAGTATVTYTLRTRGYGPPIIGAHEVFYSQERGGTATRGEDYTPPPGDDVGNALVHFDSVPPSAFSPSATRPVWEAKRTFTIGIVDDMEEEPNETIVFRVRAISSAYQSIKRTITILDDDTTPTVTIKAVNRDTMEGVPAEFTLTRTGSRQNSLLVRVIITEEEDRDLLASYVQTEQFITIRRGGATATFTLDVRDNVRGSEDGDITAEIAETSLSQYEIDDPPSATVTVEHDTHSHPRFNHHHSHHSGAQYTEFYPGHDHDSHVHGDTGNRHSSGLLYVPLGQHIHHAQEDPGHSTFLGPNLRTHDHVFHAHECLSITGSCYLGKDFQSGKYGGVLPREVFHQHEDAEPGHGYDWPDLRANGNNPAEGHVYIGGVWRVSVGDTITVDTWRVSDPDGMSNAGLSYQWLADYGEIRGATRSSYTVTDAQVGKKIRVKVTFTDDAGNEEVLRSRATLKVKPKPPE